MRPTRKGQRVQLTGLEWKHGPGVVIRFNRKGSNAVVLVKWPRKGRRTEHNARYLQRVP